MLLDFIDQGDEQTDCNRMIRLYDFGTPEVEQLRGQCIDLGMGLRSVVAVHALPFVIAIDGCELFMTVSQKDFGIRPRVTPRVFDCEVTAETWTRIAWYMEPYLTAVDTNTFHWLDETFEWSEETSEICFLFTPHPSGYW